VLLADTDLVVENFTNHRVDGTATARLSGRFMGSGASSLSATFRPERDGPDFDVQARIQSTDLTALNDVLRAHAKVDVVSGVFSMFAELQVKNRRVTGYVKPLFRDLQVYEVSQDEDKSVGRKPASTWEALVGLVRNAFFKAILPGFERELSRLRR
jgi:hypothetical protein